MMKRKVIIIGTLLGVVIIIFGIFYSIFFSSHKAAIQTVPTPTPSSSQSPILPTGVQPTAANEKLSVVSVDPANGDVGVLPSQQITITFNRAFLPEEFTFGIGPAIAYTTKSNGAVFTVIPTSPLQQATTYMISIKYADGTFSDTYSFTVGASPTGNVDNAAQMQEAWNKQFQPDIFLYGKVPYQTATFSVVSQYTATPKEHFSFIVSAVRGDTNTAKQDFLQWLTSLGLGQQQIQELDVRYQ